MYPHGFRTRRPAWRAGRAFSLVELIVVIGIIAVLMGVLIPTLGKARASANTVKCLANLRSLAQAQMMYAADQQNLLVTAGDGAFNVQGSWIALLQVYASAPISRRCPSDVSAYFDQPYGSSSPEVFRMSSYGINNYVSPTHAPTGSTPIQRITQVRKASNVIQFAELAEAGAYAVADHLHVQSFYTASTPNLTLNKISAQMPVGRHGGKLKDWTGMLNYSFLDGHAETLTLREVYTNPRINRFNPAIVID